MVDLNRVSATLSDADIADIEAHLDAIRAKLPFLISLTAQDRRELAKLGQKSIGFEEKCQTYMQSHPQFLPAFFPVEEINKDRILRGQLLRITAKAQSLFDAASDTLMVASSELWKADLAFYKNVQEAAKHGLPGAEAIYEDLASRFPGTTRPPATAPVAPPIPAGQ